MKYSKFVVALIIILNVVFTAAVLYVYLKTETEPKTLIISWFAFTTGELFAVAGITRLKEKNEARAKRNSSEETI